MLGFLLDFANLVYVVLYKVADSFNPLFVETTMALRGDSEGSATWAAWSDVFFLGWIVGTAVTIMLATREKKSLPGPLAAGLATSLSAFMWYLALCKA